MRLLPHVAVALIALAPCARAEPEEAAPACDATHIEWVFPGHFPEALAKAKASRRILIVKGVSFGIDELGATCATKGKW
jgi:hypothetical protein